MSAALKVCVKCECTSLRVVQWVLYICTNVAQLVYIGLKIDLDIVMFLRMFHRGFFNQSRIC